MKKNIFRALCFAALLLIPIGVFAATANLKFKGIIDAHEHYWKGGNMSLYLQVARSLGISKSIFVPTGKGPDNHEYKENMADLLVLQKKYPNRVIAFCTVDEADPEAPKIFEKCLDDGGKGLKLMAGHPNFYDVAIDSEIMKQLFTIARLRDVPVLVHISIVNVPQMKTEFMRLLDQFPELRIQFAHYCSSIYDGIHLDQCAEFLDRYPNLMIDLSMGGGIQRYFKYMQESAENVQQIKDFILKYQDRVLYGTDMIIAKSGPTRSKKFIKGRMLCDFELHQEESYECPVIDKNKQGMLPGFALSDGVLRKLYIENPKKFLRI